MKRRLVFGIGEKRVRIIGKQMWTVAVVIAAMMSGSTVVGAAKAAPVRVEFGQGTLVTKKLTTPAGTRAYQVYTPRRLPAGRPLITWVHGTSKVPNGDPMGLRTSDTLITEADRLGFTVVAPLQSLSADPSGMWHFFDPANQVRGQGESSIIAAIARRSARDARADPRRIYAVGHSAGGAMVHTIGAMYPDVVAAIAVSAGFPFLGDPTGVALRNARVNRPMPTFLIHGDRDDIAVPPVGAIELAAALGANGLASAPTDVRPRSTVDVPASRTDRYRTRISCFGAGRAEVVLADVRGADHRTGPGGMTLNGPALDRRVVAFLLAQARH